MGKVKDLLFNSRPKVPKAALDEVYDGLNNFLFFKTIKTGHRECYCTACKNTFVAGIHTMHRTYNSEWADCDSARHRDEIVCPVCHRPVTVINTKLQRKLKNPIMNISVAKAFFIAKDYNDVWVRCMFVERNISADGRHIRDEQIETNAYHFTPQGATYWRKYWGCFGWSDELSRESKFREPFKWDMGFAHYDFDYGMVWVSNLEDTFLKYSAYEQFEHYGRLRYWCWYCEKPQIELLVKLGHTETVEQIIHTDSSIPRLLNWEAKRPWEFFKLTKFEYDQWCKLPKYNRILALKIYKSLKQHNADFEICNKLYSLCYCNLRNVLSLAKRIGKYNKTVQEAIKYFEKISHNSAGACWHCPGITTKQVADMWIDYINMGDDGKSNFNPFPADLKTAHDNLIEAYRIKQAKKDAKTLRREQQVLVKKLATKYPKANKNCEALVDKYEYDNGTYAFVTPRSMMDILIDGKILNQCTGRPDANGENWRYFERINRKETYIGFVRKSDSKDVPWFTIEFEPGGTVRQKRAYGDNQPADTTPLVTAFLVEWQKAIAPRLNKSDRRDAQKAKQERLVQFDELRRTKKTINYGTLAGTLLIEAFEKDLMELEIESA